MVQIKVKGDGMVPDGTILEPAFIDGAGDARLSTKDEETYGTSWVFARKFEVLDEEVPVERDAKYIVTLKLKDLLELHDLLQALPQCLVESATLKTN